MESQCSNLKLETQVLQSDLAKVKTQLSDLLSQF